MYNVVKRDGQIVSFDISKIADAIKKAFDATSRGYSGQRRSGAVPRRL